jgi:NAD(P)H dehydrogenase (quinone)
MTTYAVTGASGQLGHLIVEKLIERGTAPADIVAVARTTDKAADLAERGVDVRFGDYTDSASLDAALAGVDRLALVSSSAVGQRVAQHQAVIAAAQRAGVGHIAYTSLLSADSTSNPLAGEHLTTEQELAASGIPTTLLRNSWYFENYTGQLGQYTASGAILGATQNATLSAATRADFADAAAAAIIEAKPGAVYELAGPAFTLTDLAAAITAASGTTVEYRDVSVEDLAFAYEGYGMDAGTAGFFAAVDASIAKGELFSDSDDLESLLGRAPASLADAVAEANS